MHASCRRPIGRNRDHTGDTGTEMSMSREPSNSWQDGPGEGGLSVWPRCAAEGEMQQDPRLDVNKQAFNIPHLMHLSAIIIKAKAATHLSRLCCLPSFSFNSNQELAHFSPTHTSRGIAAGG